MTNQELAELKGHVENLARLENFNPGLVSFKSLGENIPENLMTEMLRIGREQKIATLKQSIKLLMN